jgi:hypothetical protein
MKLIYIFNNVEHQALVTLAMVCVTVIAPIMHTQQIEKTHNHKLSN